MNQAVVHFEQGDCSKLDISQYDLVFSSASVAERLHHTKIILVESGEAAKNVEGLK